ncbi:MAG: D-alanyl-D-alanine carboxypeptidase [Candidatus Omnitrophica bacterium]|nr:D-alanyl-D-alanine carboxypeptidase [Candidatus Omnitrophota bacterium]
MFKRFLLISQIVFLFLGVTGCKKYDIPLSAKSAILMSPFTKRVVYAKDPRERLLPASTTKIMTALTVLKKSKLGEKVTVSAFASSIEPSKIYIKEGEEYFTGALLRAILLNSGNDASVALAESVSGSEEEFAELMNDTARSIGAKDTNFTNSNGLPSEGQYSTAYDLALIVRAAMRNKDITAVMKIKKSPISEITTGRRIKLKNHNKFLWKDHPYTIFGKTGYTKKAGHCFAGYIEYNKWRRVIVVILKSKKLWSDLEALAEALM